MRLLSRRIALCLALLLAALALTESTAQARGMTPWDLVRLRSVSSAVVSPGGDFVAYTVRVPRDPNLEENGPDHVELHVYDIVDRTPRRFVTGEVNVGSVDWTPDGRYVTYVAKRGDDEKKALYAIPVAGGESRKIVGMGEDIAGYSFDPSGSRVAVLAKQPEPEAIKERKEKGFDAEPYEEYARPNQLHLIDVDLEGAAKDESDARTLEIEGHPADLSWSPAGGELLVTLAPTSLIDDRYMDRRYTVLDAETGAVKATVQTEGKLGGAAWSPDGEHFAFVGPASIHDPAAGRLFVAPRTGGAPVELLPDFPGHVQRVAWSDAKTVVFLADRGVQSFVGTVPARGGAMKEIVPEAAPVGTAISLSADGRRLAMVADTPEHPSELFFGRTGGTLERLTNHNPWLTNIELAEQSVVEYEARDGLMIQGMLISPLNYQHGKRYPLIVVVHGGPEAHYSNDWRTDYSRPGQYMAAQGYAIFYPNYRGSTGRGVDFTLTSQGDPAGKEFDDVIDGVDHLIDAGLVDRDRVGITGGSYGGFATAWGATYYSDRYAAAVMFVGVSEQFSKFGTTDIPRESQLVHQNPKKTYEDWQFFLERSPIFHAKDSKTPLLILHGKDDPRVHPTQSMTMYRYFKHQSDAPVRLVWYPGEGHGNRKAGGKLDYSLRMMRWMNHFLVDGGTEAPDFELEYEEPESTPSGAR